MRESNPAWKRNASAADARLNDLLRTLEEREADLARSAARLEQTDEESARLLYELETLRKERKSTEKKLVNASRVETALTTELAALNTALEEKSKALQTAEQAASALQHTSVEACELREQLAALEKQLDQQRIGFDTANSAREEELSQLSARVAEQDSQLAETRRERDALECERDVLDSDLKNTQSAKSKLEETYKALAAELRNNIEQKSDELRNYEDLLVQSEKNALALKAERDSLAITLDSLRAELKTAQEADDENEEKLRTEIAKLHSQAEQRSDEIDRVYEELSRLQERAKLDTDAKKSLQQQLSALIIELEAARHKDDSGTAALQRELDTLRAAVAEKESSLAEIAATLAENQRQLAQFAQERKQHLRETDDLRAMVNAKDAELLEARQRVARLDQSHTAHTAETATLRNELERLEARARASEESLQNARKQSLNLERQLAGRSTEESSLKQELDKLRDIAERKEDALRVIEESFAKETARYRSDLADKEAARQRAETQLMELRAGSEQGAAQSARLAADLAAIQKISEERAAALLEAQSKLEEHRKLVDEQRKQLADHSRTDESIRAELDALRRRVGADDSRRAAAEAKADDLAAQLERARTRDAEHAAEMKALKEELDERAKALREAAHELNRRVASGSPANAAAAREDSARENEDLQREVARLKETIEMLEEDLIHHMAAVNGHRGPEASTAKTILSTSAPADLDKIKSELLAYENLLIERERQVRNAAEKAKTLSDTLSPLREKLTWSGGKDLEKALSGLTQLQSLTRALRTDDLTAAQDEGKALTIDALRDPRHAARLGQALVRLGIISRVQLDCALLEINSGDQDALYKILRESDLTPDEIYQRLLSHHVEARPADPDDSVISKAAADALNRLRQLESQLTDAQPASDPRQADRADAWEQFHNELESLLARRRTNGGGETSNRGDAPVSGAFKTDALAQRRATTVLEMSGAERFQRISVAAYDAHGRKRSMGEILVNASLISERQLENALEEQRSSNRRRLGSILVEKGVIDEDTVAHVLATQHKLPFVELGLMKIEPNAADLISGDLATHHMCIPTKVERGELTVAMANPLDEQAIRAIEIATEMNVHPVVASWADISSAIVRQYGAIPRETDAV